jgi:hypothetical protein
MISISQVYDTLLAQIRKDARGLSFSPDDFNNIIIGVNQRLYKKNFADFEASKWSMTEMDSFKIVNFQIPLDTNGVGVLPNDYYILVGNPYYINPISGRRQIDLITSLEHAQREMDFLTKGSDLYPTAFMAYSAGADDMSLYVTPTTCTPIFIDYLRMVSTPYLDYYTDPNLNVIYMNEGATVTIPLGSMYRDGTPGIANITSKTVDFEWHPHDFPVLVNLLLESVGISLPDELLMQVSAVDDPKLEKVRVSLK